MKKIFLVSYKQVITGKLHDLTRRNPANFESMFKYLIYNTLQICKYPLRQKKCLIAHGALKNNTLCNIRQKH